MSDNRSSFSGRIGFVLAAAGSAVGLGNLWRFPYLAASHGGGIFILCYIILALTFGFALMTTEIAIGRKTGLSCIGAYQALSRKFTFLGYVAWLVPIIILPYYSVIGGWVCKYISVYVTGQAQAAAANGGAFFGAFISNPVEPLGWFLLFLGLTSVAVLLGVEKGIEKVSKVMMPALIILIIGICVYVLTLPGTLEGLKYYLVPDFSHFSLSTITAAMGQLFYSMSLAMGIMVTYGSYTRKDVSLVKSVNQIELFDTGVAMLAGLMIIPTVFAYQGTEGLTKAGPGLMFQSLPMIFAEMPGGTVLGFVFFVLVLFAALTSSISLMETIVSMFMDKLKLGRKTACVLVLVVSLVLGVPSSMGNGLWSHITLLGRDFLSFFDFVSNNVIMPIVAFLTCILIGWIVGTKTVTDEVTINGEAFGRKRLYEIMTKYLAPICLIIILLEGIGVLKV